MGSNQGKQPHHADRGGKVWSRDEKRENRKVMRHARDAEAIEDSLASNSDEPQRMKKVGKPGRRWCRGKEGQEHDPVFVRTFGSFLGIRAFHEHRCSRCGHKSYTRGERP